MLPLRMLGLLLLMFSCCDADSTCPPEFNPLNLEPPEIIGEFGHKVYVNCTSTKEQHEGMFWKDEETHVEKDGHFISRAIPMTEWKTEVQCKIKLNETIECSKELNVTVYKNPEDVQLFVVNEVQTAKGKEIELQCDVLNLAPVQNLKVRWYRDDHIFKSDSFSNTTKTLVSTSSNVTVIVSREIKESRFRCEAQLDFAQPGRQYPVLSSTYNVMVHYAPEFKNKTDIDAIVLVREGENVTLACDAEGNPSPIFFWTNAGKTVVKNTPDLYINQVNANTTYSCNASNELGSVHKLIHIHVLPLATSLDPTTNPTAPPETFASEDCRLTLTPAEIVAEYGAPASINCTALATNLVGMGWEAIAGGTGFEVGPTVTWKVNRLEDWSSPPRCYMELDNNQTCEAMPKITLYTTPKKVFIFALDGGPMVEGTESQLQCIVFNVTSVRDLKVKWYRGNESIQADTYINASEKSLYMSSTLIFVPTWEHNGANFICKAELHLGPNGPELIPTTSSAPYNAVVHYKPRIPDCPRSYAGVEHEFSMDRVPCAADGNPQPTLLWFHQQKQINASEPLTRTQSGEYTAVFVNSVGNCSTTCDITIEYGPSFNCDDRQDVDENSTFQTICEPEGIPTPLITWSKDGKEVASPQQWTRHDTGHYTLTATNQHGQANLTLYINVLYAPKFNMGDLKRPMTMGENITLACSAEGHPSPAIEWQYQHVENVKETTSGQIKYITIIGATSTNEDVFICIARNPVGNVTRSVTLKMIGKPFPLWILVIIITLIIIIIIILIIYFIYFKFWKNSRKYSFVSYNGQDGIPMNLLHNKHA